MEHDVFLSYNSKDREAVEVIDEALGVSGLRTWLDTKTLLPGDDWQSELELISKIVPVAVIMVGATGFGPWEGPELQVLLDQATKRPLRLITVLLPGAPPTPDNAFLERYSWLDLRAGITDEGLRDLVQGIQKGLPKRTTPREPAAGGPSRHNLPTLSIGRLLKGRKGALKSIEKSLAPDGGVTAIVQQHVVHGLGGIGKTRLAIEYAWRYGHRYSHAFYVPANNRRMLFDSLVELARPSLIDLTFASTRDDEFRRSKVLQWLALNDMWLMILDNVDTEEAREAILSLLPSLARGRVIITSRRKSWPATVFRWDLGLLGLHDAAKFLLQRTDGERKKGADEATSAKELAAILGGLPLALEQAAAYINHHQASFIDYLSAWESERREVLSWYDPVIMQYPEAIATTWQASFRQLQPLAMTLLQVAAFLPPEPVSQAILKNGELLIRRTCQSLYNLSSEELGSSSLVGALSQLVDLSLASRDSATFSVHRLVQEIVKGRASPEVRRQCVDAAVGLTEIATMPSLPPRAEKNYRGQEVYPGSPAKKRREALDPPPPIPEPHIADTVPKRGRGDW